MVPSTRVNTYIQSCRIWNKISTDVSQAKGSLSCITNIPCTVGNIHRIRLMRTCLFAMSWTNNKILGKTALNTENGKSNSSSNLLRSTSKYSLLNYKWQPVIQSVRNDLEFSFQKDHVNLYIPLPISTKYWSLSSFATSTMRFFPGSKFKGP